MAGILGGPGKIPNISVTSNVDQTDEKEIEYQL